MLEFSDINLAWNSESQDRYGFESEGDGCFLVLADGSGGDSLGGVAAQQVVDELFRHRAELTSAADFEKALSALDHVVSVGKSTVVALRISGGSIFGASVGDSEAGIFVDGELEYLTEGQNVKPLMGTGEASPISFHGQLGSGVLLVGSDGFWKYVDRNKLINGLLNLDFLVAAKSLSDLARMKSGGIQDDLSLVVVRNRPVVKARKVYSLDDV